MNWLIKLASSHFMYHGTSDTLAPKILSEGIVPGRKLVWDNERAKEDERSRASYGGIYFTNNFMTAYSSARTATEQFGGKKLIVIAQLELRTPSILLDEDKLTDPLRAFNETFNVSANGWYYMQWVDGGMPDLDKLVQTYLTHLSTSWNRTGESTSWQSKSQGFQDQRQFDVLVPYIRDFIIAAVMREIAIAVKQEQKQGYNSSLSYQFPQFKGIDLSTEETEYRRAANVLMQKTNFMANESVESFMHNVRTLEPISFSGKNKIVLIARFHEGKFNKLIEHKYYVDIEILYGNNSIVITQLKKDTIQALSDSIRIKNENYVIYDYMDELT